MFVMDIKFYKGLILLYMTDHTTRLSITVILPSKKPDQIVNTIMKYWVAVYWIVDKFLTNNGSEFIGKELMTLCKTPSIKLQELNLPGKTE